MKCLAIGGEPATGKTTLFKNLRNKLGKPKHFKFKMVRGELYEVEPRNIFMLGVYDDGTFSGTDRLSMAVQPQVMDFLKAINKDFKNPIVLFEGDRLFTKNNLLYLQRYYDLKIIILKGAPDTIAKRHIDRKDNQSATFIKGRQTKVKNIENHFKDIVDVYFPVNLQESEKLGKILYEWVSK